MTDDPSEAVTGADFVHTDVWVSMGEPKDAWIERVRLLAPYQVNARCWQRAATPTSSSCTASPAFHDGRTVVGAEVIAATGIDGGLEVTDEVFESVRQHRLRPGREPPAHG